MNQPLYCVAGLGKTGHSIARYLTRRNHPFVAFDTRQEADRVAQFHAEFPGVDVFTGQCPTTLLPQLKAIIASPGVPLDTPFIHEATRLNIPLLGDIECLASEIHAPIIAITGTNGKSTVTMLVGEMAKATGKRVAVAGNIGLPVLDLLDDAPYDLWVLELSSFQLDLTHSLKPVAATILNITPDHLDRHHTFEAYIQSKQRVYQNSAFILYNRHDERTQPLPGYHDAKQSSYGLSQPKDNEWGIIEKQGTYYLAQGEDCLLDMGTLRIKGKHNWENALASAALAHEAGIDRQSIIHVLQTFTGLPHRCQWVRSCHGIDWINDSKGTNVGATASAIAGIGKSIGGKIVLIAGGQGKDADFTSLRPYVHDYVRAVVLMGADADKLFQALNGVVPLIFAESLEEAVHRAGYEARGGDVVLLSPACASFDMFRDFNHRGEQFVELVNQL